MKRLLLVFAAAAAALPFAYQTARGGSAASGESTATRTVCHKTTSTRAPYRKIQEWFGRVSALPCWHQTAPQLAAAA